MLSDIVKQLNNKIMKVNFNVSFKDYQGKEVENPKTGEIQSLKDLICAQLFSSGENLSAEEKYEAYKLMVRISPSNEAIEIEDKDSVLIKRVCEKALTVGAYGQVVELLKGE